MAARIATTSRKSATAPTLDPRAGHLTLRERRALLALIEHEFIDIEPLDRTGRHSLRQAIVGLRKKLDPSLQIVTEHGFGYRLHRMRA